MDFENSGVLDAAEEVSQPAISNIAAENESEKAPVETEDAPEAAENAGTEEQPEGSETVRRQRRGGFQKKIERLQAENMRLQAELAQRRAGAPQEKSESVRAPIPGKPTPEQFQTYDDYVEALTTFKAEEVVRVREEKSKQGSVQRAFNDQVKEARKVYPDFDEALADYEFEALPEHSARAILESPMGAEISYYIANNPEVGDRLHGMNAMQAAREIGRLEYKLEVEKKQGNAARKVTKAPPPIVPLKAKAVPTRNVYDDNLSYEEFRSVASGS